MQIVGAIAIILWTVGSAVVMFLAIKYTMGLRVSAEIEDAGLDGPEHETQAYIWTETTNGDKKKNEASSGSIELKNVEGGKGFVPVNVVDKEEV